MKPVLLSARQLRPRSATEIVDAAFQLYRRHFTALVTLSLAAYAPYIISELVVTRVLPDTDSTITVAVLLLTGWFFGSLSEAAIVVAVSNSYLKGEPGVRGALRMALRRFAKILAVTLSKWLLIIVGYLTVLALLLFVCAIIGAAISVLLGFGTEIIVTVFMITGAVASLPALAILFVRFFAAAAAVMLEGLGVVAALRRSSDLARGMMRPVLGALGLPLLIYFGISVMLNALAVSLPGPAFLEYIAENVASIVIGPILPVIATLLYYDARIRKEGFDIEVLAAEIGAAGP